MKLPVVIQHNPSGWTVDIPDNEFNDMMANAKPISKDNLAERIQEARAEAVVREAGKELKDNDYKIPDRWRKPCKPYQGFVYGLDITISADGDSEQEVLSKLKSKATEIVRGFAKSAERDWPVNASIHEIEI